MKRSSMSTRRMMENDVQAIANSVRRNLYGRGRFRFLKWSSRFSYGKYTKGRS
jgi:hypothetical protein